MTLPTRCPRCEGSMATGFVVDRGDYGVAMVSVWQAGEPKVSRWSGAKQDSKAQLPVTTLRCSRCGYLENYALTA